jgi:hypothetical protein
LPADILEAPRLQLNINARKPDFSDEQVLEVYARALELGPEIILQYHPQSAALIERFEAMGYEVRDKSEDEIAEILHRAPTRAARKTAAR